MKRFRPVATLVALIAATTVATSSFSAPIWAAAPRAVSLTISAGTVSTGQQPLFTLSAPHSPRGAYISLQRHSGGKWVTVFTGKMSATGRYAKRMTMRTTGTFTYRAYAQRTRKLPPGGSPLKRLTVLQALVVPPTTRVLDPATVQSYAESGADALMALSSRPSTPLVVGDVVTVGIGARTPNGVLGRVTSLSGDSVALSLDVTLADAVSAGRIDTGWLFTTVRDSLNGSADLTCSSGATGHVAVTSLESQPEMALTAQWKSGASPTMQLRSRSIVNPVDDGRLSATFTGTGACSLAGVYRTVGASTLQIILGTVPVVLTLTDSAGLASAATLTGGASYAAGPLPYWRTIGGTLPADGKLAVSTALTNGAQLVGTTSVGGPGDTWVQLEHRYALTAYGRIGLGSIGTFWTLGTHAASSATGAVWTLRSRLGGTTAVDATTLGGIAAHGSAATTSALTVDSGQSVGNTNATQSGARSSGIHRSGR